MIFYVSLLLQNFLEYLLKDYWTYFYIETQYKKFLFKSESLHSKLRASKASIMDGITIIIPTRNGGATFQRSLEKIRTPEL